MTSRRRASDAFGKIGAQQQATATPDSRDAVASRRRAAAPVAAQASALTVRLDADQAADVDELALRLRRILGHRVDKAAMVRVLLRLAASDEELSQRLTAELAADVTGS